MIPSSARRASIPPGSLWVALAMVTLCTACGDSGSHEYQPIDLAYFDTAAVQLDDSIVIEASVGDVWAAFEDNAAWEAFDIGIAEATWTSEPPLRAGSTRHVVFSEWMGSGTVDEVFFVWDTNQQFAFYMAEGSSSLVHSYGEWWLVSDQGDGTTKVEFRTAFNLESSFDDFVASGMSRVLNVGYEKVLSNLKSYVEDGTVPADPDPPAAE